MGTYKVPVQEAVVFSLLLFFFFFSPSIDYYQVLYMYIEDTITRMTLIPINQYPRHLNSWQY